MKSRTRGSARRVIGEAELVPYDVRGRAVLVHTGWDRHWRTDAYFRDHPFLSEAAAGPPSSVPP